MPAEFIKTQASCMAADSNNKLSTPFVPRATVEQQALDLSENSFPALPTAWPLSSPPTMTIATRWATMGHRTQPKSHRQLKPRSFVTAWSTWNLQGSLRSSPSRQPETTLVVQPSLLQLDIITNNNLDHKFDFVCGNYNNNNDSESLVIYSFLGMQLLKVLDSEDEEIDRYFQEKYFTDDSKSEGSVDGGREW